MKKHKKFKDEFSNRDSKRIQKNPKQKKKYLNPSDSKAPKYKLNYLNEEE